MIQDKTIFIVGIKGVAMANLAIILKKLGNSVSGSDVSEEFITDDLLKKNHIGWINGFLAQDLPQEINLLIYGAAHQGISNPQVTEAIGRKIRIITQAKILGQLTQYFKTTIAVCGCHGKTTTASLLSSVLIKLGAHPSYLVGSPSFGSYEGGDYQDREYFVIEADEYAVNPPKDKSAKFFNLHPDYVISTNIDFDHPDVYKDIEEIKAAFLKFFKQAKKRLFLCADDKRLTSVADQLPRSLYFSFGFNKKADYQIINAKYSQHGATFQLKSNFDHPKGGKYIFETRLFGKKNVSNAAGVVSLLLYLGFSPEKVKEAVKKFSGAKRRFEQVFYGKNIYLFDDYAHHPKEIETTIKAAKSKFPTKRIIVIFQPHTYSRTKALLTDFANSLSLADLALLLPIFPSARENPKQFKITAKDIITQAKSNNVIDFDSKSAVLARLRLEIKPGNVIFTMGAGDIYKLNDDIIKIISKIKNPAFAKATAGKQKTK